MGKTKKAILFLVEGITDKEALGLILSKLIQSNEVFFEITDGDITSRRGINRSNIKTKVWEYVKQFMDKNRFQKGDIIQIVHVLDTDGAFVPPDKVVHSDDGKLHYTTDAIETAHVEEIVKRNKQKSEALECLTALHELGKINYQIYYFSRNMEHVLHDVKGDLTKEEKMELADDLLDEFEVNPTEFISFLQQENLLPYDDYRESWHFIEEACHSLKRSSNLGLFFE